MGGREEKGSAPRTWFTAFGLLSHCRGCALYRVLFKLSTEWSVDLAVSAVCMQLTNCVTSLRIHKRLYCVYTVCIINIGCIT